jgi:hypothetical protein
MVGEPNIRGSSGRRRAGVGGAVRAKPVLIEAASRVLAGEISARTLVAAMVARRRAVSARHARGRAFQKPSKRVSGRPGRSVSTNQIDPPARGAMATHVREPMRAPLSP